MGELRGEEVTATRPERYSVLVSSSQAAVAVKLDFVEPFLVLGNVLNGERVHWLDKLDAAGLRCLHYQQSKGTDKKLLITPADLRGLHRSHLQGFPQVPKA